MDVEDHDELEGMKVVWSDVDNQPSPDLVKEAKAIFSDFVAKLEDVDTLWGENISSLEDFFEEFCEQESLGIGSHKRYIVFTLSITLTRKKVLK